MMLNYLKDSGKCLIIILVVSGCASTTSGRLFMEFESDKNKIKLYHDKIIFEKVIARW